MFFNGLTKSDQEASVGFEFPAQCFIFEVWFVEVVHAAELSDLWPERPPVRCSIFSAVPVPKGVAAGANQARELLVSVFPFLAELSIGDSAVDGEGELIGLKGVAEDVDPRPIGSASGYLVVIG